MLWNNLQFNLTDHQVLIETKQVKPNGKTIARNPIIQIKSNSKPNYNNLFFHSVIKT